MTTVKSIGKLLGIGLFVLGFVFAVAPTEQVLSQTTAACSRDSAGTVTGGKLCAKVFTAQDAAVVLATRFTLQSQTITITSAVVNSHIALIPGIGDEAVKDMLTYLASGKTLDTLLEFASLSHLSAKGNVVYSIGADQLAWIAALFKLNVQ